MKKLVLIVAILSSFGFAGVASANVASHVFSWSGTVPASSTQTGWIIKTPQKADITPGILVFNANAQGRGELIAASNLAFNVFDYAASPTVGAAASNYTYQLTSLAVNTNSTGLAQEQGAGGYFDIKADGTPLVKGTDVVKATGGDTTLTVAPNATGTANQPAAGEDVNVQATIVVTAAA